MRHNALLWLGGGNDPQPKTASTMNNNQRRQYGPVLELAFFFFFSLMEKCSAGMACQLENKGEGVKRIRDFVSIR